MVEMQNISKMIELKRKIDRSSIPDSKYAEYIDIEETGKELDSCVWDVMESDLDQSSKRTLLDDIERYKRDIEIYRGPLNHNNKEYGENENGENEKNLKNLLLHTLNSGLSFIAGFKSKDLIELYKDEKTSERDQHLENHLEKMLTYVFQKLFEDENFLRTMIKAYESGRIGRLGDSYE